MVKALINGLMSLVSSIIDLVLAPINALIMGIFPDLSSYFINFTNFIDNYVGSSLGFFSSLLPPITKNLIAIWLGFVIVYYTASWTYSLTIKIYNVIQKIKFW